MKLEQVDVPVHSVVWPLWPQPQPVCAMHVDIVLNVVHVLGVPLHVDPFHVQPVCAMHVLMATNVAHEVAVPPHKGVQPGQAAVVQPL